MPSLKNAIWLTVNGLGCHPLFEKTAPCSIWPRVASTKAFD